MPPRDFLTPLEAQELAKVAQDSQERLNCLNRAKCSESMP